MNLIKNIIKRSYPLRMKFSKVTGMGISNIANEKNAKSAVSFYSLNAANNKGEIISFEKFRGKKILIVNLASQCGYTPQYEALEQLNQLHKDELVILGFPSNDFGEQEPGNDEEIAQFCKVNFGVTFPIFLKDHVKAAAKQSVYQWLSEPKKNGWNSKEPTWNFYKYLVDENGNLDQIFSSSVSPLNILKG